MGERLYFKVDVETQSRFAAAFTYLRRGKRVAMSYREPPSEPASLLPWAELGLEAARRARAKRQNRAPRRTGRYR